MAIYSVTARGFQCICHHSPGGGRAAHRGRLNRASAPAGVRLTRAPQLLLTAARTQLVNSAGNVGALAAGAPTGDAVRPRHSAHDAPPARPPAQPGLTGDRGRIAALTGRGGLGQAQAGWGSGVTPTLRRRRKERLVGRSLRHSRLGVSILSPESPSFAAGFITFNSAEVLF